MTLEIEDRSYNQFRKRPFRLYVAGRNAYSVPTQETLGHYATKESAERAKAVWLAKRHAMLSSAIVSRAKAPA